MKRAKFLALALVVAIMMMGAGYAYWTESLEIETTVNTGKLDYKIEYDHISQQDPYMENSKTWVNALEDGQKLNIRLDQIYPGAKATVKFDIVNTGTMAAKLNKFYVENEEAVSRSYQKYLENLILESVKVDGYELCEKEISIWDLTNPDTIYREIGLEKGERRVVEMTFRASEAAEESNFAEKGQFKFSIKADVLQHNHQDVE